MGPDTPLLISGQREYVCECGERFYAPAKPEAGKTFRCRKCREKRVRDRRGEPKQRRVLSTPGEARPTGEGVERGYRAAYGGRPIFREPIPRAGNEDLMGPAPVRWIVKDGKPVGEDGK